MYHLFSRANCSESEVKNTNYVITLSNHYGHLNSIQVDSNDLPFTAWKEEERNRHRDKKNLFTMTSGGFMIVVRNNSFIDSKQHSLEPTYLVTILKALVITKKQAF